MRYSVIIPVYNGEKTIGRCLDSFLNQHYDDMEILLINDGSTDGTDAICRQYNNKYASIRYFSKQNGGVSSARNIGLKESTGRYILFADCDDYVSDHYFAAIDKAIDQDKTELLVFSWTTVSGGNRRETLLTDERKQGGEISKWAEQSMQKGTFGSLWSKVFLTDVIRKNHLFFNETLRIAEDWSFIFRYILFIDSMRTLSTPLYSVSLENDQSLSRKARTYLSEQLYEANQEVRKTLEERNDKNLSRRFAKPLAMSYFRSAYSASKELRKFEYSAAERREQIRGICERYAGGRIRPAGLKCRLMAIPVFLRLTGLIDFLCSK